ncbi:hypothetical protein IFM89_002698 [Coptis chinensis]|uniref:Membrane-associated kinase regulator 1 n=1 Tax=Coptis chinensis TaxID=261450 RepID=A0A835IH29_9MAGN|nr:hypothetical protein IFM89_002698 [Coptis chinensis]
MGRRTNRDPKSQTLPPSPSHSFSSSSSSDFEFIISSLSSRKASSNLCPADDLFYKGQLLPLHLSPRLSMVRTLFLASSSTSSSSDTTTTASRDSTGSSTSTDSTSSFSSDLVLNECDSSRPSSVTEEDDFKKLRDQNNCLLPQHIKKPTKYFSLARISSVFKKDNKNREQENGVSGSSVKRAKEVIRKYVKKVKPLYEKLSQKQQQQQHASMVGSLSMKTEKSVKDKRDLNSASNTKKDNNNGIFSNSFSGNIRYPRRKSSVLSCPSSMRSSPNHSGVLCKTTAVAGGNGTSSPVVRSFSSSGSSSMEELQNAIQGAIAHCKNSMVQNKNLVSNEI